MVEIEKLIALLLKHKVEFVVVGGVAATAYGSTYVTQDLDICYRRNAENIRNLVQALSRLDPRLRGPDERALDVRFVFDEKAIQNGLNFTLITTEGSLDLLGELPGIGGYEDIVAKYQATIQVGEFKCSAISLDGLIANKSASGRPKDLVQVIELKAIQRLRMKDDQ